MTWNYEDELGFQGYEWIECRYCSLWHNKCNGIPGDGGCFVFTNNEVVEIKVVVLEYIPSQDRVLVRGVWRDKDYKPVPLLIDDDIQNVIRVFENVDMKFHVGFSGLRKE